MLYKKNSAPELARELFENPTSEYRGTPFWAWNCKLEKDELLRQIDILKQMGFGGFHMHVRSGMATPYLSDEFMDLVGACVDKARDEEMLAWLYDEDRWPSGFAGGFVTKDPQYRIKYLLFTPTPYEVEGGQIRVGNEQATAKRSGLGHLIAVFDVVLDDNGCLKKYMLVSPDCIPEGKLWYAYVESPMCSARYNGYTYANTLDRKATERFIELTHEKYRERFGHEFDKVIPAIFTDEPQFTHKNTLNFADVPRDVALPWTDDIGDTFRAAYGEELVEHLPEMFWELADGEISKIRYHFHDHVCERFVTAFADTCGEWCAKNGIMLTGHVMKEPTLESQTQAVSEAMRNYRSFQLPGIDMLANRHEFTTAKQAQSAAHQYGREGVMSELYGVTGWDYDFRGHKLQGDWQAALGITVRVPHLSWVSMEGEAKRDYPASINYQSSWYSEYAYIENHFARLNTALTRGTPDVKVGVIHPIESYWLHWGPSEQTALIRNQLDTNFQNITSWLLYGCVDFDFISESLLPELCNNGTSPLHVGKMSYDVIIVPECETLRSTTLEKLQGFAANGGKLIFMGAAPKYIDADPSAVAPALELYNDATRISFSRGALLSELAPYRTVDIRNSNGSLTENLMYQLRTDGDHKWLFVANATDPYNNDVSRRQSIIIYLPGNYSVELYDTLSGKISNYPYKHKNGKTVISYNLYQHDSILLKLTPSDAEYPESPQATTKAVATQLPLPAAVPFTLDEPNVFMLDLAEYCFDGGEWQAEDELLRIDTKFRKLLGWTPWNGSADQPWYLPAGTPEHSVKLRFKFTSDIEYTGAQLALELPNYADITFNSQPVSNIPNGYFADRSIKTVALPTIKRGENILEIAYAYGERTALEWCYILGNFGVEVNGRCKKITSMPSVLAFGNITSQSLPFYSGAVTYHLTVESHGGDLEVTLPQYRAGVTTVALDGGEPRHVAFAPYKTKFKGISAGAHQIDVKLYLPRTNTFGQVHLTDEKLSYPSPGSYRTAGDMWSYEYQLRREGLTSSPWVHEITYQQI
ncbi:MAG: hypothetical protein IJY27_05215 [Clostridia bacterium]|nr:hypothetical protein [Clostridia bacterium]